MANTNRPAPTVVTLQTGLTTVTAQRLSTGAVALGQEGDMVTVGKPGVMALLRLNIHPR